MKKKNRNQIKTKELFFKQIAWLLSFMVLLLINPTVYSHWLFHVTTINFDVKTQTNFFVGVEIIACVSKNIRCWMWAFSVLYGSTYFSKNKKKTFRRMYILRMNDTLKKDVEEYLRLLSIGSIVSHLFYGSLASF